MQNFTGFGILGQPGRLKSISMIYPKLPLDTFNLALKPHMLPLDAPIHTIKPSGVWIEAPGTPSGFVVWIEASRGSLGGMRGKSKVSSGNLGGWPTGIEQPE